MFFFCLLLALFFSSFVPAVGFTLSILFIISLLLDDERCSASKRFVAFNCPTFLFLGLRLSSALVACCHAAALLCVLLCLHLWRSFAPLPGVSSQRVCSAFVSFSFEFRPLSTIVSSTLSSPSPSCCVRQFGVAALFFWEGSPLALLASVLDLFSYCCLQQRAFWKEERQESTGMWRVGVSPPLGSTPGAAFGDTIKPPSLRYCLFGRSVIELTCQMRRLGLGLLVQLGRALPSWSTAGAMPDVSVSIQQSCVAPPSDRSCTPTCACFWASSHPLRLTQMMASQGFEAVDCPMRLRVREVFSLRREDDSNLFDAWRVQKSSPASRETTLIFPGREPKPDHSPLEPRH